MESARKIRIGVTSDTHGLLRPAALDAMRGSALILHAGDICDPSILRELEALAPVTAVRGNNDRGHWADGLREVETIEIAHVRIGLVHDVKSLGASHQRLDWNAIVSGHSHKPRCETRDGVLHFNPGSAGPRRFTLPVSVGEILIEGGTLDGHIIHLAV